MKIYVTKYALSSGILVFENAEINPDYPTMASVRNDSCALRSHFHGDDWHTTTGGAMAKAEEMRLNKISSLKKSIKKLESLKFQFKTP